MEELGSLWSYQLEEEENIEELKKKLFYITLELESFKLGANDEIVRTEANIRNLMNLLKTACKERDEARHQLQKALQKLAANSNLNSNPVQLSHGLPQIQPESPLLLKSSSSVTEPNSFSEPYNHHSYGSSPVDSFLDGLSSPEFSSINVFDSDAVCFVNQPFATPDNRFVLTPLVSSVKTNTDPADAVMENLSKGKPLPQKGKLLQAVVEAGISLQTLLLAGPLPRWHNPPPMQSFKIPPINLKTCETSSVDQSSALHKSPSAFIGPLNINFQTSPPSTLNFSNGASRNLFLSSTSNGMTMKSEFPLSKLQRLH